ncbi:hypothetical protein GCM10025867_41020 [Frondihabitans sucicola]|uniref:Uncharacterized protein n=1 Tax=Frondihabitans sucicola TaxID=1268041 RepID=A0ABM8GTQ5_9MICO|nr:hypothetical protein [Frondihabitans sucicola]BDZ51861.1 hypothetical protein GCM10025867_41020 [Frondihabitans sucicola]
MTPTESHTARWRELTVGLLLPDVAFGAAVDIEGLLVEPELHFAATPVSSRLLLMPRAGTFSRLLLEWENLPEIGVFTASTITVAPLLPDQIARLETWMRDVAVVCHANRDRIREASERAVRDAAAGLDTSLPPNEAARAHVVSAHVGTSVVGPQPGSTFGVVDVVGVVDSPDEMWFVEHETGSCSGVGSRATAATRPRSPSWFPSPTASAGPNWPRGTTSTSPARCCSTTSGRCTCTSSPVSTPRRAFSTSVSGGRPSGNACGLGDRPARAAAPRSPFGPPSAKEDGPNGDLGAGQTLSSPKRSIFRW